jgi:hypothetical protein
MDIVAVANVMALLISRTYVSSFYCIPFLGLPGLIARCIHFALI